MNMKWLAIPLTAIVLLVADSARAQPRDPRDELSQFSPADRAVIERNEMLRSVVDSEPVLVRRVLDALAKIDDTQSRSDLESAARPRERPVNRSKNPDVDRLDRSSPEAMNDLFQLLKQASGRRPATERR